MMPSAKKLKAAKTAWSRAIVRWVNHEHDGNLALAAFDLGYPKTENRVTANRVYHQLYRLVRGDSLAPRWPLLGNLIERGITPAEMNHRDYSNLRGINGRKKSSRRTHRPDSAAMHRRCVQDARI